jgi:hypothetical protein
LHSAMTLWITCGILGERVGTRKCTLLIYDE